MCFWHPFVRVAGFCRPWVCNWLLLIMCVHVWLRAAAVCCTCVGSMPKLDWVRALGTSWDGGVRGLSALRLCLRLPAVGFLGCLCVCGQAVEAPPLPPVVQINVEYMGPV